MSQTDSFIAEVTDEVKRDKLYGYARRYGWIAVAAIVALVGGAAWREYSLATKQAAAEELGANISVALDGETPADRLAGLSEITTDSAGAAAMRDFLAADQAIAAEDFDTAKTLLDRVANDGDLPTIYRQIARFKFGTEMAAALDVDDRRAALEELNVAGQPLRLLALEQLMLLDVETGATDDAVAKARTILDDAEITANMTTRIGQLLTSLGVSLDDDTGADTTD